MSANILTLASIHCLHKKEKCQEFFFVIKGETIYAVNTLALSSRKEEIVWYHIHSILFICYVKPVG